MIYKALTDIYSAFKQFNNQAILFAVAAMVIYSVIIIFHNMYNAFKGKPALSIGKVICKLCIFALFGMYASYTISLTLSGREAGSRSGIPSLVPGATIFTGNGISLFSIENWLLFIPLGILAPILWKYSRSFLRILLLGFICSTSIELVQFVTARGYFEIDDIILNTLGAITGYIIFSCVYDGYMSLKKRIIIDVAKSKKVTPPLGGLFNRFAITNDWAMILLQLIPVVLCINMIMGFSADNGNSSREISRPVAFVFTKLTGLISKINAPSISINNVSGIMAIESDYLDMVEKIIRKFAHITEYALLSFCVWALIFARVYIKRFISYATAIVVVGIVGMCDEINQTTVVGRWGSPIDVGIDMLGAFIMMLIVMIIVNMSMKYYKKRIN